MREDMGKLKSMLEEKERMFNSKINDLIDQLELKNQRVS